MERYTRHCHIRNRTNPYIRNTVSGSDHLPIGKSQQDNLQLHRYPTENCQPTTYHTTRVSNQNKYLSHRFFSFLSVHRRQHFEYISLVCSFQRQFPSILVPNRTYNDSLLDFLYKVTGRISCRLTN